MPPDPEQSIESTSAPELIADELALLGALVPLEGVTAVDLGCGAGDFARSLVARGRARSVDALEVDTVQHGRNTEGPQTPGVAFGWAGAEHLPLPDDSRELVVMLKSLHHVPVALLDRALIEISRVLKPAGYLYVSEPVYAGEFNEIVRIFHDEGEARAAAWSALQRAVASRLFESVDQRVFVAPLGFRDFDDFAERIVYPTHSRHTLTTTQISTVRSRFERFMTPSGANFVRPMRVWLLRKPP